MNAFIWNHVSQVLVSAGVGSLIILMFVALIVPKDERREAVGFMTVVCAILVAFMCTLGYAQARSDYKVASAAAEAKSIRKIMCNNINDDVAAYRTFDEYTNLRDRCLAEFGTYNLRKSGAPAVWTKD